MADTTEKKTYLINIESNLDKYAKEADEAAKKVAELKVANQQLLQSGEATGEEIERNNAALRTAQKEYANAKKSVDLATAANKAQSGSYEQLYRQWQLAQTQLKLMGSAYIVDANGVRTLSQKYIENKKAVEDAKRALDSFGKGVADNRLNVGNYSEALQGALGNLQAMPGPLGAAVGGLKSMTLAAKAFIATPIGAVLAAVAAVIGLLVKAFKNSQPLMDLFDKTVAAISATFKVLLDRVSNFTEFLGSIFSKELRQSRAEAKALNDELIGIEETMSRREKRELRRANRTGIIEEIKEEAKAAYDLKAAEKAVDDAEIGFIQRKEELRRSIEELINSAKDENLTNKEKLANFDQAIKLQAELTAKEVSFAKERARISQEQVDQGNSTRDQLRENEELQAAATAAEVAGLKETKRIISERFGLVGKIAADEQKGIKEVDDAKKKAAEEDLKRMEKAAADAKKILDEEVAFKLAQIVAAEEYDLFFAERKKNQELINAENRLAIEEATNSEIYELQRKALDEMEKAEVESAIKAGADVSLVNDKFTAYRVVLAKEEQDAKMSIYSGFASSIATLFGENTKLGRIAAITATVINTYRGAMAAFAETPGGIIIKSIAAATAVAAGIASVKKIVSTKSGLPGDSGGGGGQVPTAISASAPAVRSYAGAVGSSVLNTPQLNQQQINALPNQNILTAADLAAAFGKMPPPVVTVEDINARVETAKKVEVRGTI